MTHVTIFFPRHSFVILNVKRRQFSLSWLPIVVHHVVLCRECYRKRIIFTRKFPSRLSQAFATRLRASDNSLTASVTVPNPTRAFTCILDFAIHPSLCEYDVVLGLDWAQECFRNGASSTIDCLPVYHVGTINGESTQWM